MKLNIIKSNNETEIKFLKDFLRVRIPIAVKGFKEFDTENNNTITFENFAQVLKSLKIPSKYTEETVLRSVFEESIASYTTNTLGNRYTGNLGTESQLNFKKFVEELVAFKGENDFYSFKDQYLEKLKNKIENSKKEMNSNMSVGKIEADNKKMLHSEIREELDKRSHERLEAKFMENNNHFISDQINNCQPSKQFNERVFTNKEEFAKMHLELEKGFSAHPSLMKGILHLI